MKALLSIGLSNLAMVLPLVAVIALVVGYLVDYTATVLGQPVGGFLHILVLYFRWFAGLVGY